ncbi:MAG: hypothetical protein QME49_01485 [bacterium]|nr:hypothetical protein [bacterium]
MKAKISWLVVVTFAVAGFMLGCAPKEKAGEHNKQEYTAEEHEGHGHKAGEHDE